MTVAVETVIRKKGRRTLLPLLVVLFLISYSLLTGMVIQQSRTINSQRTLIHLLFKDNVHLSALRKGHPNYGHAMAAGEQDAVKPPSSKIPVIQVPPEKAGQAASSSKPREQADSKVDRKSRKVQKQSPARPPADLTDPSDMRRVSFSI